MNKWLDTEFADGRIEISMSDHIQVLKIHEARTLLTNLSSAIAIAEKEMKRHDVTVTDEVKERLIREFGLSESDFIPRQ